MTTHPGDAGRAATHELRRETHERTVHLIDVPAVQRALAGSPVALTELERDAVIVLADTDGIDKSITARSLTGWDRDDLATAICHRRRRAAVLTRDLRAAAALRPAAELVDAVASGDADAVADVLCDLGRQQLAALSVVLAAAVSDPGVLAGIAVREHADA